MTRQLAAMTMMSVFFGLICVEASAQSQSNNVIGNRGSRSMSAVKSPSSTSLSDMVSATPSQGGVTNALANERPIYVTVIGQVGQPGVYEFRNDNPTLVQLLSEYAGGLTGYSDEKFYLLRPGQIRWVELDKYRHMNYQFEDGDILLAETPVRYYQNLANGASGPSFFELHPMTQIVLVGVFDRPVLYSVNPRDARLAKLLQLLNQNPSKMIDSYQWIEPFNANQIPTNAGIPPNTIISGSILKFEPSKINKSALPKPPTAISIITSNKLKVASNELTVPSLDGHMVKPESFTPIVKGDSKKSWDLPGVSIDDPSKLPGEVARKVPTKTKLGSKEKAPFHEAYEVFDDEEASSTDESQADLKTSPSTDEGGTHSVLSDQQLTYLASFFVIVSLFGIAWYIRYRQGKGELEQFLSAESRYSSHRHEPMRSSVSTESLFPRTETEQKSVSEPVASEHEEELVSQNSSAENDFECERESDEVSTEVPIAVEAAKSQKSVSLKSEDQEQQSETPAIDPTSPEQDVVNQESVPSPRPPKSRTRQDSVPQTIMDNPLMLEMLQDQARRQAELASAISALVDSPEDRKAAVQPPEEDRSKPKFRIDQAHKTSPQPLFPIIWQQGPNGDSDAKMHRYQAPDKPSDNLNRVEESTGNDTEEEVAAKIHQQLLSEMPDEVAPEAEAKLMDRVFKAVMRERLR